VHSLHEYTQGEAPSTLVLTRTVSRLDHFTHTNGESPPLQANFEEAPHTMSAAAAESLFMSKFGLSVGGEVGQTDGEREADSATGEVEDVFKNMDTECKICMHTPKVIDTSTIVVF
jgi:hypothetical protein